jgi:hypothetical protein
MDRCHDEVCRFEALVIANKDRVFSEAKAKGVELRRPVRLNLHVRSDSVAIAITADNAFGFTTSPRSPPSAAAAPPLDVAEATVALLSDGRVVRAGGSLSDRSPAAAAHVYDPATDTWASFPPAPAPLPHRRPCCEDATPSSS